MAIAQARQNGCILILDGDHPVVMYPSPKKLCLHLHHALPLASSFDQGGALSGEALRLQVPCMPMPVPSSKHVLMACDVVGEEGCRRGDFVELHADVHFFELFSSLLGCEIQRKILELCYVGLWVHRLSKELSMRVMAAFLSSLAAPITISLIDLEAILAENECEFELAPLHHDHLLAQPVHVATSKLCHRKKGIVTTSIE